MRLLKITDNFHAVFINQYVIWFSYDAPIAYQIGSTPVVIRPNRWGKTTGKHMNFIKNNHETEEINEVEFLHNLFNLI